MGDYINILCLSTIEITSVNNMTMKLDAAIGQWVQLEPYTGLGWEPLLNRKVLSSVSADLEITPKI